MADKLNEAYEAWRKVTKDPVLYQAFQGGFTAGAVSMRTRAMKVISSDTGDADVLNNIQNKIGQLSDIPTE